MAGHPLLDYGVVVAIVVSSVSAASFIIRWAFCRTKREALQCRRMEQLERDAERDRRTHKDVYDKLGELGEGLSDIRDRVGKLEGKIDALAGK